MNTDGKNATAHTSKQPLNADDFTNIKKKEEELRSEVTRCDIITSEALTRPSILLLNRSLELIEGILNYGPQRVHEDNIRDLQEKKTEVQRVLNRLTASTIEGETKPATHPWAGRMRNHASNPFSPLPGEEPETDDAIIGDVISRRNPLFNKGSETHRPAERRQINEPWTIRGQYDNYNAHVFDEDEDIFTEPTPARSAPVRFTTSSHQQPQGCRNNGLSYGLSLYQAINTVPTFDGNPDTLPFFCQAIRNLVTTYGLQAEHWLTNIMSQKLKGSAADGYIGRLTQYSSVEELLSDLTAHYKHIGGADAAMTELKMIQQKPGEGVGEYGLRVQTLHTRILTSYDSNSELQLYERQTYKKQADKEVLDQFLFGLNGDLQHQVRSKSPYTLQEAIHLALDFEHKSATRRVNNFSNGDTNNQLANILGTVIKQLTTTPASLPTQGTANIYRTTTTEMCEYCKGTDHREENCSKKRYDIRTCKFCHIKGHTYSECRSLRHALNSGEVTRRTYQGPPPRSTDNRYNTFNSNRRSFNDSNRNRPNRGSGYYRDDQGYDRGKHQPNSRFHENYNNNSDRRNNYSTQRESLNSQDARRQGPAAPSNQTDRPSNANPQSPQNTQ